MFAGRTTAPPNNWLICDGRTLDYGYATPAYQGLFNVIGRAFNTALTGTQFALPNLVQNFPIGAGAGSQINVGVGAVGGEANHVLSAAELASHAHGVSDPTHAHGAYQNAHSHGIATGGHSHGINDPGHAHAGVVNVVGVPGWNSQGPASPLIAQTSTSAAGTGISIQAAGNLGGNTDTQQPGNLGGSTAYSHQRDRHWQYWLCHAAHNNVPPYVALNFIIRFV